MNIYYFLRKILYGILSFFISPNKITLIQYDKNDSYGNISLLYEKMKEAPEVQIICGKSKNIIEEIKNIYMIACSRVIATDTSSPYVSQISHSTQTDIVFVGHGGGAFKKMAFAAMPLNAPPKERKRIKRVSGKYTYVLCTSESIKHCIAKNYNIDISRVLPLGLPRTDAYYGMDIVEEKNTFFKYNNISKEKKLILYAPTFRNKLNRRCLPPLINEKIFPNDFYDKYCILFRGHPTIKSINIPSTWIDVTNSSLKQLLSISDFIISDFSSIIFDYSFFKRPILLFIPDEKIYQYTERSLWYSPQDLVGHSCCYNSNDILSALNEAEPSTLWSKQMDACDGHCCIKISKFLFDLLGGQKA